MEHRSDAVFRKPSIFREGIREYAERSSSPLSAELADIAAETARAVPEWADISTAPTQVAFLQMLLTTGRMERVLEVGTFTGHGTVAMAAALPDDGEIITIDNYVADKRAQDVANQAFARSPHQHKIKTVLEEALPALQNVTGDFDLIFLDADKPNYITYFETILARGLLRPRGLLVVDNTMWGGEVLELRELPPLEEATSGEEWVDRMFASWAHDVVRFNKHIVQDPRVRTALLTVHDGMTVVQLAS
ncbi:MULTISPECIES: O-methyltransferase [unclassified Streptomyces]|uniref:O-methyltransferase n=1 Tax=unclassified Streptomyces TaxID=2593676 RepID=UPI0023497705|nr:class I SAM-dependent methyltransferase [Streptomyces sp. M92]WCN03355.1 class I SAM-dependent methyltransferase [Streptomyces sp. M92]